MVIKILTKFGLIVDCYDPPHIKSYRLSGLENKLFEELEKNNNK
jgi:hypothetical protein